MRAFSASALVLVLAACSPAAEPAKAQAQAEPAAAAAATSQLGAIDLTQPIRASGTEPFYAVTLSDGKTLTLTLTATECPDIGEETRALTSSLAIPGGITQQACADARTAYPPET